MRIPKKRKVLPIHAYREWENHPITIALQEMFQQMYYEDSTIFLNSVNSDKNTIESIALRASELRGRNQVLEKFIDLRDDNELKLKTVLDDLIEWEK